MQKINKNSQRNAKALWIGTKRICWVSLVKLESQSVPIMVMSGLESIYAFLIMIKNLTLSMSWDCYSMGLSWCQSWESSCRRKLLSQPTRWNRIYWLIEPQLRLGDSTTYYSSLFDKLLSRCCFNKEERDPVENVQKISYFPANQIKHQKTDIMCKGLRERHR